MGHICLLPIQRCSLVLVGQMSLPQSLSLLSSPSSSSSCLLSLSLISCPLSLWRKYISFVLRTCS